MNNSDVPPTYGPTIHNSSSVTYVSLIQLQWYINTGHIILLLSQHTHKQVVTSA